MENGDIIFVSSMSNSNLIKFLQKVEPISSFELNCLAKYNSETGFFRIDGFVDKEQGRFYGLKKINSKKNIPKNYLQAEIRHPDNLEALRNFSPNTFFLNIKDDSGEIIPAYLHKNNLGIFNSGYSLRVPSED